MEAITSSLSNHLSNLWGNAYTAKQLVHEQLIKNLRAFQSKYSPEKLAAIMQLKGSEDFLPLTATKCNAAMSWLRDIIIPYKDKSWTIVNTPNPEFDEALKARVVQDVMLEVSEKISTIAFATGTNPQELLSKFDSEIQRKIRKRLDSESYNLTKECEQIMEDQLTEGNWYSELNKMLFDVVVFPAGIMKGPIYRRVKKMVKTVNPYTGEASFDVVEDIQPFFDRISPFNLFPSANCTNTNDGYIFEILTLTPTELSDLRGLPNYDSDAIDEILNEHSLGNLGNWTTAQTEMTINSKEIFNSYDNVIEALEFWGDIKGELLLDWGLTEAEVPDPNHYYPVQVIKIKDKIIKAMINPDPLGRRLYTKTSYLNIPGSFWGMSLVELLSPIQKICNSATRAVVNNCAFACGPITEMSMNRLPKGTEVIIHPMMVIESTDIAMSGSPAVRFYQPNIIVEPLLRVIDFFGRLADNYSIPSYAHGDTYIGGAGNTASGLHMLMGASNRIIKNVVSNIDSMIEESLRVLYSYNLMTGVFKAHGDMVIKAKGSTHLIHKEQQMLRRTEFLRETNNPVDIGIIGMDGRRELLYEVAKTMDFENLERIVKEHSELDIEYQKVQQMLAQAAVLPPKEAPQNTDHAGNPMSGQNYRLFQQSEVMQ